MSINHYTAHHEAYVQSCEGVLQACRSADVDTTLAYIAEKSQLATGQFILDCGSGLGYPAKFFSNYGCLVLGLNNCPIQVEHSKQYETPSVNYHLHSFDDYCIGKYDRIMFLESIGHTKDLQVLMNNINTMLMPSGLLYIKHSIPKEGKDCSDVEAFFQYKEFTAEQITQAALNAGLLVEEVSNFQLPDYSMKASIDFFNNVPDDQKWSGLFDDVLVWKNFIFRKANNV